MEFLQNGRNLEIKFDDYDMMPFHVRFTYAIHVIQRQRHACFVLCMAELRLHVCDLLSQS